MDARQIAAANVARLANGRYDEAQVAKIVDGLTDEQVAEFNQSCADSAAERVALRDRLMADKALRSVVCPPTTWRDAHARYDVARSLVKLLEAYATKHEVTVDDLVAEMVKDGNSIARELEMFGDDSVGTQWGTRFYGFRFRVQDAIKGAKREETQRAWAAEVARHEAMGEVVCDRCGGAGGHAHWPGFDCYDCGGRKFVRKY